MEWNGKPYHSLDYELRQQFGRKIYKLSLDGGRHSGNRGLYLLQPRRLR